MDKAELRRAVIARRDAIDLDVRKAKSAVICTRLVELLGRLDAAAPRTVAVYAAMGSEADPAAFAAAAAARGWRAAYPCMLGSRSRSLWPAYVHAGSCRRRCVRGSVYHSSHANLRCRGHRQQPLPIVPAEALDMIVVPLVAFDQTGARLGYGGGCYDRYLSMLSPACQIVGIAFDEQRIDHVPTDVHDLPLPNIVSA